MILWPIIFISLILLILLLVYEKREGKYLRLISKTLLSSMFLVVALQQSPSVPEYSFYIILALVFCLIGDVCLALPGDKAFRGGLVAFLLGHVFYVVAFSRLIQISAWVRPTAAIFWVLSLLVFLWLRPHLKTMILPVGVYVVVITSMVSGAWAAFVGTSFLSEGRSLVLAGAFLFYLSDLFVARNQFIQRDFINRLIGLPLYYLGQFLLAFSIGLL
ncbi:MAG: lysoplasmalogenase [Syntrophaceae bacterium]|jgi:uncharacterized membrane protein YhhN|nr:lysoplasmalogenase [Syntrophaceae bacterium]